MTEAPHPDDFAAGQITALAELLPALAGRESLMAMRALLRRARGQDRWPRHRLQAAELLAETCRRLVSEHAVSGQYLTGVGDLPPATPDDLSELGGPDG